MGPIGLVPQQGQVGQEAPSPRGEPHLLFEDALSSPTRLWIRGRLLGTGPSATAGKDPRWWKRWWGKAETEAGAPLVHLETRISGHVLHAQVPAFADGRFEATFSTPLPPARRGWRIARNRVSYEGHQAEGCCLVLS